MPTPDPKALKRAPQMAKATVESADGKNSALPGVQHTKALRCYKRQGGAMCPSILPDTRSCHHPARPWSCTAARRPQSGTGLSRARRWFGGSRGACAPQRLHAHLRAIPCAARRQRQDHRTRGRRRIQPPVRAACGALGPRLPADSFPLADEGVEAVSKA